VNFQTIKFRASQTGRLMTDPRGKSELISETTKDYLTSVYIEHKYNRRKELFGSPLEKGVICEDDSITMFSRIKGEFYKKNEENFNNDWLTGTPDIITDTMVIDLKTPYDIFSFWKSKQAKEPDKMYYYQIQAYLDLVGRDKGYLVYCLVNTPDELIEQEKRKYQWQSGLSGRHEITPELLEQIEHNFRYDDIPIEERVHIVEIPRNQEDIEKLHQRVIDARIWMEENFK
jgi:hypothetical protein